MIHPYLILLPIAAMFWFFVQCIPKKEVRFVLEMAIISLLLIGSYNFGRETERYRLLEIQRQWLSISALIGSALDKNKTQDVEKLLDTFAKSVLKNSYMNKRDGEFQSESSNLATGLSKINEEKINR
jgi:hypothetical protein